MSEHRSMIRWMIYMGLIAMLLVPLVWLSQPATIGANGGRGSPGGKLAQMRTEEHLGEANLGKIDPTSETLKLMTFGMRGVAVLFLWNKANRYKKEEDWDGLTATLEQMTLLQPHFVSVWRYQSWNLAFNVAAEFDDYRVRYFYAKKGITFLMDGTVYNQREPRMLWDVGWMMNQKIGRSDERVQFRRLFAVDEEFHDLIDDHIPFGNEVDGPRGKPDNWLVGRQWYLKAEKLYESDERINIGQMADLLFFEQSAKCRINFAEAIEKEGTFGEVAGNTWKKAEDAWREYGRREMPGRAGRKQKHRLGDLELHVTQFKKLRSQIDDLQPGLRKKMEQEKLTELNDDVQKAYRTAEKQRSPQQSGLAADAQFQLDRISDKDVAERIEGKNQQQAMDLAVDAMNEVLIINDIEHSHSTVPYQTWLERCQIEQSPHVLAGREHLYLGNQQYERAQFDSDSEQNLGARQQFERGFAAWARAFKEHKSLIEDRPICEDLVTVVAIYRNHVLDRKELPDDFPLLEIIKKYPSEELRLPEKPGDEKKTEKKPVDEKPVKAEDREGEQAAKPASDE